MGNDSFKLWVLFERIKCLIVQGYLQVWSLSEHLCVFIEPKEGHGQKSVFLGRIQHVLSITENSTCCAGACAEKYNRDILALYFPFLFLKKCRKLRSTVPAGLGPIPTENLHIHRGAQARGASAFPQLLQTSNGDQ